MRTTSPIISNLTVVCFLWKGWRPLYDFSRVNILKNMLETHLKIPHRLICVTDTPENIECETMPLWDEPFVRTQEGAPNCYRRLALFKRDAGLTFGERILSIDLDCVMFDDITPLITDHDFRIVEGYNTPYNGSMFMIKSGAHPEIFESFDPKKSPIAAKSQGFLGSDQAWFSYRLPRAKTWNHNDGVQLFLELRLKIRPMQSKIMFFPGLIKPWDERMMKEYPVIFNQYKRFA